MENNQTLTNSLRIKISKQQEDLIEKLGKLNSISYKFSENPYNYLISIEYTNVVAEINKISFNLHSDSTSLTYLLNNI